MSDSKTKLALDVVAHMGVSDPIIKTTGQVRFTVGRCGADIVLGVTPQFTTVDMTPAEARDLARNLMSQADEAERSAREVS